MTPTQTQYDTARRIVEGAENPVEAIAQALAAETVGTLTDTATLLVQEADVTWDIETVRDIATRLRAAAKAIP